ncbi:MAG: hypothetical protein QGH20_03120 [Candidatus Latescibacteria bacterium]|nr:hypothetical protein [Candidatus Latescibacterota bacterium]
MSYPAARPRRLRQNENLRRLVRQTHLTVDDVILPLFVRPGQSIDDPIGAMPGCSQMSIDVLVEECRQVAGMGIPGVILFGIPDEKDPVGTGAYDPKGIVPSSIRAIKAAVPDLLVWADVCMCEYTSHGHCGIIVDGGVDNDQTLPLLAKASVAYTDAGADVIAGGAGNISGDSSAAAIGPLGDASDSNGVTDGGAGSRRGHR